MMEAVKVCECIYALGLEIIAIWHWLVLFLYRSAVGLPSCPGTLWSRLSLKLVGVAEHWRKASTLQPELPAFPSKPKTTLRLGELAVICTYGKQQLLIKEYHYIYVALGIRYTALYQVAKAIVQVMQNQSNVLWMQAICR